jgi:hypothetical protein
VAGFLAAALMAMTVGSASAASYPAGGSTFTGSAEGWKTSGGSCVVTLNLPLVCNSTGGYDGTAGNPAGSMAANSEILVNVGGLFTAALTTESPEFKVAEGGAGTLRLDRSFSNTGLVSLTPQLTYTASLIDKTAGSEASAITETVGTAPFGTKEGAVNLIAGHTYAIKIVSSIDSTVAGVGLLGTMAARFDNVSVVPGSGGGNNGKNGENGGNGQNGLTDSQLTTLMQSSLVGPAVLKGKHLYVKAKCPAKVGATCRIGVTGLLSKGKAATTKRNAKVAKGKSKQVVLTVKAKSKAKLAKRSGLLFKETVRAGGAKATVYKHLKLIRR